MAQRRHGRGRDLPDGRDDDRRQPSRRQHQSGVSIVGVGDFDGDGKADILWRNDATGDVAIFLMNGLTIADSRVVTTINSAWSIVGAGDFDGDGKTDILWHNAATGEVAIFLMNGSAILGSRVVSTINPAWSIVGVGDFDGDGKADILWRNMGTGDNAVFLMDGFHLTGSAVIQQYRPRGPRSDRRGLCAHRTARCAGRAVSAAHLNITHQFPRSASPHAYAPLSIRHHPGQIDSTSGLLK
jgi:sRNA-binding regulator protein Hfq